METENKKIIDDFFNDKFSQKKPQEKQPTQPTTKREIDDFFNDKFRTK